MTAPPSSTPTRGLWARTMSAPSPTAAAHAPAVAQSRSPSFGLAELPQTAAAVSLLRLGPTST
jgi:hypothetical protein